MLFREYFFICLNKCISDAVGDIICTFIYSELILISLFLGCNFANVIANISLNLVAFQD
jgi:hypothetical protein